FAPPTRANSGPKLSNALRSKRQNLTSIPNHSTRLALASGGCTACCPPTARSSSRLRPLIRPCSNGSPTKPVSPPNPPPNSRAALENRRHQAPRPDSSSRLRRRTRLLSARTDEYPYPSRPRPNAFRSRSPRPLQPPPRLLPRIPSRQLCREHRTSENHRMILQ